MYCKCYESYTETTDLMQVALSMVSCEWLVLTYKELKWTCTMTSSSPFLSPLVAEKS